MKLRIIKICLFPAAVLFLVMQMGGLLFSTQVGAQLQDCIQPPSSMIGWWAGDGTPEDIQGNNDVLWIGTPAYASAKVAQGFSFDGAASYVKTNSQVYSLTAGTVDFWFMKRGDAVGGDTLTGAYGGSGDQRSPSLLVPGNTLLWEFGSLFNQDTGVSININRFYHVAMTYLRNGDGSYTINVYVDGWLVDTGVSADPGDFLDEAHFGHYGNFGENFFNGVLDEVEIFNRALSQTEIAAIYNAQSAGKCRSCLSPPSEMVGWWAGDGNANDIQVNNHGMLKGDATFASGKVAQAFSFDGNGDYVEVPDSPNWDFGTNEFTIDAWLNFNSVSSTTFLIGHDEGGGCTNKWIFWLSNGNLQFHINDAPSCAGSAIIGNASFSPTPGVWYHVALTRSGNTYRFYVDGNLVDTATNSNAVPDAAAPLTIGQSEGGNYLNGLMDEVEIFNRALSLEEIQAIYNAQSAGKCKNTAPVAQCRDVTVTLASAATTAQADVNDGSFDPDGDTLTFNYNPAGPYPAGQTVVTLTVDDGKGKTDSCMGTVTVQYQFKWFSYSDLLSNPQYFIQAAAGSNVAIRFSLNGFQGDPYSLPLMSQQISCTTKAPIGAAQIIDRFAPDPYYSSLYDFYQTTWRTQPAWKFTCRRLTLYFKDGTTQSLDFYFK